MLDSGEADTWRYSLGSWTLNTGRLASGSAAQPWQNGIFRRQSQLQDGTDISTLYINTNKTADRYRTGPVKGYVIPWPEDGLLHQQAFYWLEKLRNWQEKYNPISHRTSWTELDGRHLQAKSELQLASYPNTCFLFRTPEAIRPDLPVTDAFVNRAWFHLLDAFERRLALRSEMHGNGVRIRLLADREVGKNSVRTLFPLHSLRVSLITALALEGNVPFPILQKLVGHSRLLMTLYYTKPGVEYIREQLMTAAAHLEANKERSIQDFLTNTEHDTLVSSAISNCSTSLAAAIPVHITARNPAGWMPMHHGLCLVGGNTCEVEGYPVGGCHNGGPNVGNASMPIYAPVPGGIRNCIRCRWFVTEPHHLPALAAHFNTIAYHFDEARNACLSDEKELQALRVEKAEVENARFPYTRMAAFRQAERVWESAMSRFSDLAEDLVACYRLIERCGFAINHGGNVGSQLVAAGTLADVQLAFEETASELRQLSGVCESAEIYPDLDPGKAIFRRSQLLDAALYREELPPIFLAMSEHEQLVQGNAFMRKLASQLEPNDPALGTREVIRLIDVGERLSERLGIDVGAIVRGELPLRQLVIPLRTENE